MLRKTTILTTYWLLTSFFVIGQTARDTSESFNDGHLVTYCKGAKFNSVLFIIDTLTKDTLEVDKQVSQNSSISILYQNNKPKYKIVCKAYLDEKARKTRREERHHNFVHRLPRKLRGNHKTCFFPTFYYGKSAKIISIKIYENNKWVKHNDKTIKPVFALFDTYTIPLQPKAKF